jgi:HPt (histidine-containing phosphotransfer) domain-containing protein
LAGNPDFCCQSNLSLSIIVRKNNLRRVFMSEGNELIDMEEILEIMDNDTELIQECFQDFMNEYPQMLTNIQNAILSGDTKGLDSHAHKLKGSLRYLAASTTADIASKLEYKGKKGELEGTESLLETLSEYCEKLKAFMNSYKG